VQVYYNTKVVYTAEDMIALYDGFEALEGGEFSAEIMPCPNSFNERISNNTQDIQDSTFFDNVVLDRLYDKNIKFIPNPSSDNVKIEMDEDDFYDLKKIELVSPLGQVSELPKQEIQDISNLENGLYFIKFYFTTGHIVVKPLMVIR
jgi:hypothetical protein